MLPYVVISGRSILNITLTITKTITPQLQMIKKNVSLRAAVSLGTKMNVDDLLLSSSFPNIFSPKCDSKGWMPYLTAKGVHVRDVKHILPVC